MIMTRMRHVFLILIALLFMATAGAVPAAAQTTVRPSCDVQIDRVNNNYSSTMRVRNQAMTAQVVVRNDSALSMACFDQAMSMTSMAGQIFSDVIDPMALFPSSMAAAASEVGDGTLIADYLGPPFGSGSKGSIALPFPAPWNITVPLPGLSSLLLLSINNTVNATLGVMLQNMVGSFMSQLSTVLSSVLASSFADIATQLIAAIGIGGLLSSLTGALGPIGITVDLSAFFKMALKTVMDAILGPGPPQMLRCPNMGTTWSNTLPNGGVVGGGISGGVPYITTNNLFNKVFPPAAGVGSVMTGVGNRMMRKLTSVANNAIIDAARNDNAALSAPGTPAAPPSQQLAPVMPPNPTTAAIIGMMN